MLFITDKEKLTEYAAMRNSQGITCDNTLIGYFKYLNAAQGIFDNPVMSEPERYRTYTRREWIDANTAHLWRMRNMFVELREKNGKILLHAIGDRLHIYLVDFEPETIDFVPGPFKRTTSELVRAYKAGNPAAKMLETSTFYGVIYQLEKLIYKKIARCEKYLKRYAYKVNLV